MKKLAIIGLFIGASAMALSLYAWTQSSDVRHYTVDELVGLTCEDLGQAHEEVIVSYHDAALARGGQTGSVGIDLGLPQDDVLPFVILMRKVIEDNDLAGFDPAKPFFHSTTATAPRLHTDFYAEASSVCATSPTMDAVEAMVQAARNLGLIAAPANP
ncbi:hypothetical protein [Pseudogemmobacter sp. W21_MBD1_M6]|uniref:hypothetical protein n=1 Tax=Pseudogemmobacter sp. W21_MBD1_M6 TaxID=3240271 RepID=UPI003F9475CD